MQFLRKYCIFEILFLLIFFIFLSMIFVGHQGSLVIDCGREAYLPSEVLKGKVLYKDIFNIYGPFAYQFNAFLYAILGENLSTLYKAGMVNSLITIISVFLIAKNLSSKEIALATSLTVMTVCVFSHFIFNFIFPYSYAMIYALSGFLLSALFLILYTKTSKEWLMPLSTFFAGVSLASKYEYILYIIVLAVFITLIKPLSKKYCVFSAFSFLLVPALCFGILFLQGLTTADLQNNFLVIKKMMSSETLKFFYSNFIGLYPDISTITLTVKGFLSSLICLPFILLIYAVSALKKNKFLIVFILPVIWIYMDYIFTKFSSYELFCWLSFSNLLIFTGFCVYYFKIGGIMLLKSRIYLVEFFKNIKWQDKCFMMVSLIGVLASLKSLFYLNVNVYGTFMLPVVLITNTVFISDYIPKVFVFIDKSKWQTSVSVVLVILALLFGLKNMVFVIYNKNHEVKTQKGRIFTRKEEAEVHNNLIKYIQKNTKPENKILVLPEGPMVNFLTGRASDDTYNSLIPLYVETFGEKKIIKDLSTNMPDFIFLNNRNCFDYGYNYICHDYALEICRFIKKNYTFEKKFGNKNKFVTLVYKKK
jgi:hypothetical protein